MHSHDRTMLAKLGFADPDKKDPRHDLACLYLTQPGTCRLLGDVIQKGMKGELAEGEQGLAGQVVQVTGQMEYHLTKGEGQYSTTIGFIDVMLRVRVAEHWRGTTSKGVSVDQRFTSRRLLPCEVKVARVGIGDLIRQMALYCDYLAIASRSSDADRDGLLPRAVVVTRYQLAETERVALVNAGLLPVVLGKGFDDWAATANGPAATDTLG